MLHTLWNLIKTDDSGQDLAEYALLLALIAIVVMLAIPPVADAISATFGTIAGALGGGGGS